MTAFEAFDLGSADYDDHKPLTANPFPVSNPNHESWIEGWESARTYVDYLNQEADGYDLT
jgi:hypothetical protein